jgi:hypothetical protein
MTKLDKMIGLEEAIALVMQQTNCSRRKARKIVAGWIKDKKIRTSITVQSQGEPMPPREAGEAFELESESAGMPLGYFIERMGFKPEDILQELRAGRLVAGADENTRMAVELGLSSPLSFFLSAKAIKEWLYHPKTPPHLIETMCRTLSQRRQ